MPGCLRSKKTAVGSGRPSLLPEYWHGQGRGSLPRLGYSDSHGRAVGTSPADGLLSIVVLLFLNVSQGAVLAKCPQFKIPGILCKGQEGY